jgi:hypothetical protein
MPVIGRFSGLIARASGTELKSLQKLAEAISGLAKVKKLAN